jgi:hypothetical protein
MAKGVDWAFEITSRLAGLSLVDPAAFANDEPLARSLEA